MVFVDTSFWFALRTTREGERHERARKVLPRFRAEELVTSDRVVEETWTLLNVRSGHHAALDFARVLRGSRSKVRVAKVDERMVEQAWSWLEGRDERPYSFVDATSFSLMRALRVHEALSFDDDFAAAGFSIGALRAE